MALEDIAAQFKGLSMGDLIGSPLNAACDAQVRLAQATVGFIQNVGFTQEATDNKDNKGNPVYASRTRTAKFAFKRPIAPRAPTDAEKESGITDKFIYQENVEIEVPVLSIVKIPSLAIETVDIIFDMEVKSSESSKESTDTEMELDAQMKFGWGAFSATVNVRGSVASHKENTRSSDNSAKYHVEVHARDSGMPEGLARVMDIMAQAVAPSKVEALPAPTTSS